MRPGRTAPNPARSALMKRVRRSGTKPEEDVAVLLRELGIRMRRNVKGLPGTPDFANKSRKIAVFVHGCFWHGHIDCKLARTPSSNSEFWSEKLRVNRRRDSRKARLLRQLGFRVVTIWQCEIAIVATRKLLRIAPQNSSFDSR